MFVSKGHSVFKNKKEFFTKDNFKKLKFGKMHKMSPNILIIPLDEFVFIYKMVIIASCLCADVFVNHFK